MELQETSSRLFFAAIAQKIESEPALLLIALEKIERWLATGQLIKRETITPDSLREHYRTARLPEWSAIRAGRTLHILLSPGDA